MSDTSVVSLDVGVSLVARPSAPSDGGGPDDLAFAALLAAVMATPPSIAVPLPLVAGVGDAPTPAPVEAVATPSTSPAPALPAPLPLFPRPGPVSLPPAAGPGQADSPEVGPIAAQPPVVTSPAVTVPPAVVATAAPVAMAPITQLATAGATRPGPGDPTEPSTTVELPLGLDAAAEPRPAQPVPAGDSSVTRAPMPMPVPGPLPAPGPVPAMVQTTPTAAAVVAPGQHSSGQSADDRDGAPSMPTTAIGAPMPVAAPAATTVATGVSATSTAVAHPAPAEQLVRVVAPLRSGPDGTHELALELRPEGLGTVHLTVRVEGGAVHVALGAELPATAALLTSSLGDLRTGLEAAGLTAGSLAVRPDSSGARPRSRSGDSGKRSTSPLAELSSSPSATSPAGTGSPADGLDLLL